MALRRSGRTTSNTKSTSDGFDRNRDQTAGSKRKRTASAPAPNSNGSEVFATPQSKRRQGSAGLKTTEPSLNTPTPAAVNLLAHTAPTKSVSSPVRSRKVTHHATNAPLQTPRGSKILRYPGSISAFTLSQTHDEVTEDSLTTDNLLEEACAHLVSIDPTLQRIIDKHYCKPFSPAGLQEEVEPFQALSSGIMAQQVSGAAANSIKQKFIALFPPAEKPEALPKADLPEEAVVHFPTPQQVVQKDIATLRTAGLSQRKAEYIHGLAEKFVSGQLSAEILVRASDEEILERLVAVRGLGRWSVEMFAMFALKRTDIFSTGDLGVQRGIAAYKGRDVAKLKNKGGKWKYMSEIEMLETAEPFAPYRSIFMWYMWRIEDVNVEALS